MEKKFEQFKEEGQGKWKKFKLNFKHERDGIGKTVKDLFKGSE
jgi:hypothetical protein